MYVFLEDSYHWDVIGVQINTLILEMFLRRCVVFTKKQERRPFAVSHSRQKMTHQWSKFLSKLH